MDDTWGTNDKPVTKTPDEQPWGENDAPVARGLKGWARDVAATAVKGAIGVPEAVVGLADIATGGRVGKFLENEGGAVGFRPKEAKELVNDWHSDATKEAQRKFQQAEGLGGKFMAAVENPSNIVTAVGESLPAMGAGGVAARGLMAAGRGMGFVKEAATAAQRARQAAIAGAAGEGVSMAGSQAEQIRQETPDGLLTPGQSALAGVTGLVGGMAGVLGARASRAMGVGDADTMLAQGRKGIAKQFADDAAAAVANPLVQQQAAKSIPRQVIEGAISEGFLEELPQSIAEQVFQNLALGKDWLQDVDAAAVMGVLSGGVMGGGAAGYHGLRQPAPGTVAPPAGEPQPGQPQPAAEVPPAPPNPGMDRVRQAYADQLAALQAQEQGEALGPQSTPPDGAAILVRQQSAEAARRQAAQDASRSVASPDDEIHQSTGAAVPPSVRMGLDPAAGPLSAGAALAVDTGVSGQMQQAAALAQSAEQAQKGGEKPAAEVQEAAQPPARPALSPREETGLASTLAGSDLSKESITEADAAGLQAKLDEVKRRAAGNGSWNVPLMAQRQRIEDAMEKLEQATLQDELQSEINAPEPVASGLDAAFASVREDAGPLDGAGIQPQSIPNSQANGQPSNPALAFGNQAPEAIKNAANIPQSTTGAPNGHQADQTQQTSAQPPQGRAAPAGQPAAQGLTDAAQTANPGAQASTAPGAQAAPAEETREQRAERVTSAGDAWTRMTTTERQALAQRADLKPVAQKNVHRAAWADLASGIQRKLADAMEPSGKASAAPAADAAPQDQAPAKQTVPDYEAQVAEMLDPANPRTSVTIEAGHEIPESVFRTQTSRRTDPGYTMKPGRGGVVELTSTSKKSATHQDPGAAPEAVTPAVVAQSVETAAKNEGTKPSEMRKWLVGEIDQAVASAPEAATGYLTFDVPGDGTFKVLNSRERLQEFRKNVMASPGFKDRGQAQAGPQEQLDSARNGSGGTVEAIRNFLSDGDVQGAVEYARLKGVEFTLVAPQLVLSPKGKARSLPASVKSKPAGVAEGVTQVEAEQLHQYLTAEKAKAEPAAQQSAQDFIPAPDGGLDYGEITPEMGKAMRRQAGKIRLQQGVQNSDGTGHGLAHIEANHGEQIRGLGFDGVADFVARVAGSIQQVWQVPGNSQLLVTVKDGRKDVMYIQLEIAKDGDFYRVNSAFPVRQQDYEARQGMKKIWDGSEPTSAVTGQRPAFATAAIAAPDSESSQGSSNARGQNSSVPATAQQDKPQPITRADVDAARRQAATLIGERIDAMSAGDVNQIAKKFLPTMGMKPTVSKERNKVMLTDVGRNMNLEAAAAELEVELPADVRRALDADTQGRVVEGRPDGHIGQDGNGATDHAKNDRDHFTLERMDDAGNMAPVTFARGETIKVATGQKPYSTGAITGISHADRQFQVDGRPYGIDFGYAYPADYDEFAQPRADVDKGLDQLAERLDDGNTIQSQGFIDSAKAVIAQHNLGDYAKARMAELSARAAGITQSVVDKARAARERTAADAAAAREAEKAATPAPPIQMTMEEWKATPKDYKGVTDGKRTVLREGGMRLVEIIKPKSVPAKVKDAQAARADYFTPGNIVKSYGGHDRVIAYTPPTDGAHWSVTVQAVRKEGDAWADVPNEQERVHWTQPDARELKAGPVVRAAAAPETESAQPESKTPALDAHVALMKRVRTGEATADELKAGFAQADASNDALMAELNSMTKDALLKSGGYSFFHRYRNDKKGDIVAALANRVLEEYALGRSYGSFSFVMSATGLAAHRKAQDAALRELVANTTDEDIQKHAQEVAAERAEAAGRKEAQAKTLANPETLADFRAVMRHYIAEGDSRQEAFLRLTPEQRARYDAMEAESTKDAREQAKAKQRAKVATAGQLTTGQVIETKHTKHGHDLFVVQLGERVSREDYDTLNASARRMGGSYSSYRAGGAVPGFQFRTREAAEAFGKLVAGDAADAQAVAEARRDAFDDDRSQSAGERLRTMAQALQERAAESLGRERKANTDRRARMAASAEASARADKALAGTMENLAQAIADGKAKFLDAVRQKVQVELLASELRTAKDAQIRAKHPTYAEQERHRGEPVDAETVDFSTFPSYTAMRSDLAALGRQMQDVDGTKKLGARLMSVADDVSEAYTDWAKQNLLQVSRFGRGGELAEFGSREDAERAIRRSGIADRAIVLQIKRGQNRVVLAPSEAMKLGLWSGDGDKRITLSSDFGAELVEAVGRRAKGAIRLPWVLESAYEKRKRLGSMGVFTASEYRAALREFAGIQEAIATPDKIKEMERSMVGRRADGLDFFPTSEAVVDSMLAAAEIEPGMAVLEPSAGMGHIADAIREHSGVEPDVVEMSGERRELLEAKGYRLVGSDFTEMKPRAGFTYGDVFRDADGALGVMRGSGGMGSDRVGFQPLDENGQPDARIARWVDRNELTGVEQRNGDSGYDRIIMNPPFSKGRDVQHVRHAYELLRPGGRLVAIMGEGAFFQSNKAAEDFRAWLDERGATSEKLPDGSFMDPSLPVNTSVSARMVVIDKTAGGTAMFSRSSESVPQSVAEWLPDTVIADEVEKRIGGFAQQPPVRIRDTAFGQLPGVARNDNVAGAVHDGAIYLFRDQLGDRAAVQRTLFHELFHYGLRKFLTKAQFTGQMMNLYRRDKAIKDEADRWAATADGLRAKEFGGSEYALARGVDEALAILAEPNGGPHLNQTARAMFVRRVTNWLADVAQFLKMDKAAAYLRSIHNSEARAYIQSIFKRLETDSGGSGAGWSETSGPAFSRASTADLRAVKTLAVEQLNAVMSHPGKLNWWHKTIGTMYNIAERAPAFKPVFQAAQGFVDDVSHYANDAAELAPRLLPKLETWSDIGKSPVSAVDNKAVSKPVFEGTLMWSRDAHGKPVRVVELENKAMTMTADQKAHELLARGEIDPGMLKAWMGMPLSSFENAINTRYQSRILTAGVVWSDAELKGMFSLNDSQIALYKEFRAATDRSLDTMGRADMLRYGGEDVKPIRDMVMDAPDVRAAVNLLREHLADLAKEDADRADHYAALIGGMEDRAEKVEGLQANGYAPLSRFGRYTVDVVVDGERQYFSMFETIADANAMAQKMRQEFGATSVTQGTMSDEAFKMFAGITPESLEEFGNMLGLDSTGDKAQDKAFQEYLRLTKNNRSAMKRLIHRKGIAGYSEDVGRVLASFIYSNSRQTAAGLHMGDMAQALADIPQEQGELKDVAMRLAEYVKNPQEEAQAIRGLLFAQYLGGSVASAFVNMSQPVAVTFPWLSQFGGAKQAAGELARAAKQMATKGFVFDAALAAALHDAEEDGTVSPQEVHQLMAQASGRGSLRSGDGTRLGDAKAAGQNAIARLSVAWGKVFGAAEQVNRRMTFIAAYRVAVAQGMAAPAQFAKKAVTETQFLYSKANKMRFARGAVGGTLMTFKTYSVAYLELLHRMYTQGGPEGKRAALLALGMLMLMGGAGGLPFMEDVEDVADALAQMMGYNISSKQARQQFLREMLPHGIADFIEKGVSGLPGAPLDVSGRLGMGNLIPGTGVLMEKSSHTRDVLEIAGPMGDFATRVLSGARKALTGDIGGAALEVSPTAVRNAAKGIDMASTGMYRDAKGYKVLDTNTLEAALKAIGFQPSSVAIVQEANGTNQQAKNFYNLQAQEIRAKWARGIFESDKALVDEARSDIADWNRKNPDQPMVISIPSVMARVNEMRKPKDQRIADSAPKAMRAKMLEELKSRAL